jgi:hypothetical protein
MPAKIKPKPEEEVPEQEPDEPASDQPTAPDKNAELVAKLAAQNEALLKRLEAMEKRMPPPTDEESKAKAEDERLAKTKAENDAMLADYKEMLESRFGIRESVDSLDEARIIMRTAKANKLDLQSLSEKAGSDSPQKPKTKPIIDVSKLKME